MIFNKDGHGAEELRQATSSYYANADFDKISGIVETVQGEVALQIGLPVMDSIDTAYQNGTDAELVKAAQRCVGYMSVLRYFRLNDISHETDGRKVKMDSDNERRPFEWQLERDDQMHLQEYYNAFDRLVLLLQNNNTFKDGELYKRQQQLCITNAGVLEWVTGIEATPYLYMRMVPFLHMAQMKVEERLGSAIADITDEALKFLAQAATGNRGVALFVQRTEMRLLPSGAFREAVKSGAGSKRSTTEALHDFYQHMMEVSENYVKDMQCRRDVLADAHTDHLVVPNNDEKNKFFIV